MALRDRLVISIDGLDAVQDVLPDVERSELREAIFTYLASASFEFEDSGAAWRMVSPWFRPIDIATAEAGDVA